MKNNNPDLQRELFEYASNARWHNKYFSATCCYHDDRAPSMMVYQDGFVCKACGAWGTLEKLECTLRNLSPNNTVVTDSEKLRFPAWKKWLKEFGTWDDFVSHAYKKGKSFPLLLNYVRKRGVGELIESEHIGWYDQWIVLPVLDELGYLVDVTVRGTTEGQIRYGIRPRTGVEDIHLYADWRSIRDAHIVYICYGIFDRLTLTCCGYPALTGISGKSINPDTLTGIRKQIVVIPDFREELEARKLVQSLGWRGRVLVPEYPDGCKDLNDVLKNFGKEKVKEIIDGA